MFLSHHTITISPKGNYGDDRNRRRPGCRKVSTPRSSVKKTNPLILAVIARELQPKPYAALDSSMGTNQQAATIAFPAKPSRIYQRSSRTWRNKTRMFQATMGIPPISRESKIQTCPDVRRSQTTPKVIAVTVSPSAAVVMYRVVRRKTSVCHCRSDSVPGLSNDHRRAAHPEKKFAEFGVDVLVAAVDQELDVLDDIQHCAAPFKRLR